MMSVEKTYIPKAAEISQQWYLVDANDQILGRVATQIARILLGKNKPNYRPGLDTGDHVIVINCERVRVTGKRLDDKIYYHHTQ
jgi:large subunit ribosomal protein L13